MNRVMEITTPVGEDLLFHGMHAREELSRPSEYQIDLLSEKTAIPMEQILGKLVTVKLMVSDDSVRYYNGYVTRFSSGGKLGRYTRYFATVRPWLWFLSRTADCRIFQEQTVPEILKEVFADHGTADVAFELTGSYRKWTYCVQYRETDLNFVSRLMEQEGMYYYFRHTDGHDTVVITDSTGKHAEAPGCGELPVIPPAELARADLDHISSWECAQEIQPGVYVHDDYDFVRPSVELKTNTLVKRAHERGDYEVYDWPGEYAQKFDGEHYAKVRIDEFATQFEGARAVTNARGLLVGHLLNVTECPRDDQNGKHLVLSASYDLQFSAYEGLPEMGGASYQCSFSVMTTKQQFRPRRITPKPFVQGPQTAVVVGPAGEEIYTDDDGHGQVKVQFHWDRRGQNDAKSSCWIRVSHPWAGKGWGAVSLPRIGQEVIVDFLEGDPDQPIITGRVYNAEQMHPYALPGNKTQAGIKSRSSLGGSPDNFNEIRMEDKKGAEQLFIHAEKNQDIEVENDETHWVGHDRTKTIDHDEKYHIKHDRIRQVDNDEHITINRDRSETVHRNKTIQIDGNHAENIDGAMSVTVGKTLTENVLINYAETVGGAMEMTVGAALAITVGALMSEAVAGSKSESIGGSKTETTGKDKTLKIGKNYTQSINENQTVTIGKDSKATIDGQQIIGVKKEATLKAKKVEITADDEIVLKTGDAEIVMKKNGDVTIKGGKITIKGSGDVIVKGSKIAEN